MDYWWGVRLNAALPRASFAIASLLPKSSVQNDNINKHNVVLNGFKNPPNRFGYDVFTFQLVDENLKTMGDRNTMYTDMDKYCSLNSNDKYNGIACVQKARSESDYFKWAVKNLK